MRDGDRPAVDTFVAELRQAWTMAGPPSYEDFKKLSMRVSGPALSGTQSMAVLSRSTTQDILAGRRQHPPKWQWVARFLTVLRVAAAETGVDPDSLGTLAEWKQKHEAACAGIAARRSVSVSASRRARGFPGRSVCPAPHERDRGRDPALASLLRAVGQEWWREFRDLVPEWFGPYLSLEPATILVRTYETTVVPGLLQTREYAEAAIRASARSLDEEAIGRLVELRMRRQWILTRSDAPKLWVLIDEAAIRRGLGGAETMRRQISHLIEMARQPRITIQIIPLDTSINSVAGGPIAFLRFPRSDVPDVVYLEQLTGALYLRSASDVCHYMGVLDSLGIESLRPDETMNLLRKILRGI